jgi:DNA polymerase III subunit epsilon
MRYQYLTMVTKSDILQAKLRAVILAKKLVSKNTLILDTETTGLGEKDEIVEVSIINIHGMVLINSLIKPTILMPPSATAIHGISNFELSDAPYITAFFDKLINLFKKNYLSIYNAPFDLRLLNQSLKAHGEKLPDIQTNIYCIMELFAMFNGDYDLQKKCYRWVNLSSAAEKLGVTISRNIHRTMADVELTRQILLKIAEN